MQRHAGMKSFKRRQLFIEHRRLGNITHLLPRVRLVAVAAENANFPLIVADDVKNDLDRCRFAGTVGADKAEGLAFLDDQ